MTKDKVSVRVRQRGDARRDRRSASAAPWIWIGLGVAAIAGILLLLPRLSDRGYQELTAAEARDEYQRGAFILDVRARQEWDAAHIPGSVVIPLDELAGRLDEIPENGSLIVVCVSGVRSAEGSRILAEAGFSPVSSLSGGLKAWEAAGYPLESSPP